MNTQKRKEYPFFLYQWVSLFLILSTLGALIFHTQFQERRRIETQERERLTIQAETVEKNVEPQLLLANRVMEGILHDLPSWRAEHDGFARANRQLQVINDTLIGIRPILVIEADGNVIASSNETLVGMNFAYRGYFQTALKNPDPRILHVSAPFNSALDTFIISLFRTITGPKGEFGGIVIVSVVPEYFSILLDSVRYAPDLRAAIIHGDGRVFLMSPSRPDFAGKDVAKPGSRFTKHRESGQDASVFTGNVLASGEDRLTALNNIQLKAPPMDKPLVVVVDRKVEALFVPWRKGAILQGLLFGLIALTSILGLFFNQRRRREQFRERKRTEDELRKEHENVERYLRVAEVMLLAFDTEARVTLLNRKGYSVLGYEEGELLGQNWFRLCLPPEAYDEVWGVYQRILAGDLEPVEYFENQIVRKDGERRLIAWHNTVVRDGEGRILGTLSSGEDITDRKQAEEQKRILEAQLQQTQKMESLGSLAGGIAHDMNNVLGAILGLASVQLEIEAPESPAHQAFDTIAKAAVRGGTMVKGLLSFSRLSPAEERELDLNAILREEALLLEHTTLSKVHLVMDLEPGLRPIRGDSSSLTHAFMNLCVNAVEAMPEHGTLTLRTRNVNAGWIEVMVEDSGTGMSKEVLEKAMDPFFTTKEVGKGTGLGLSMVYRTVKAHQGQLEIRSEPGQGTLVRMRLPACEPRAQDPGPLKEPGIKPTGGSLRVLLVDDDELVRSSTRRMLELLGCAITAVISGEEALEQLEAGFQPEVVILDMNMPGLGGAGTLPLLRALRPEVPVLLATGRADQVALDLVEAYPRVTLLPKPFSKRELQAILAPLAPR